MIRDYEEKLHSNFTLDSKSEIEKYKDRLLELEQQMLGYETKKNMETKDKNATISKLQKVIEAMKEKEVLIKSGMFYDKHQKQHVLHVS